MFLCVPTRERCGHVFFAVRFYWTDRIAGDVLLSCCEAVICNVLTDCVVVCVVWFWRRNGSRNHSQILWPTEIPLIYGTNRHTGTHTQKQTHSHSNEYSQITTKTQREKAQRPKNVPFFRFFHGYHTNKLTIHTHRHTQTKPLHTHVQAGGWDGGPHHWW